MPINKRRTFLKRFVLGSMAVPFSLKVRFLNAEPQDHRIQKGDMFYRRLGRTDLYISEISLGGSPLPEWALLQQLIERGVNYIDTSYSYMNGNSERLIGKLFQSIGRNKLYVGTKFSLRGSWSYDSIIRSVENSLERLQTKTIDVLLIHGVDTPEHLTDPQVLRAFDTLKKQGKYRFKGLSCHSNHHEVVEKAVDCGHYDMVQLGYNVFDLQESEKPAETYSDYLGQSGLRRLIRKARKKDMGIIAMKTLKHGGKLQNLKKFQSKDISIFQSMFKWALDNPDISSVTTEILSFDQMEEDLAVAGSSLTEEERRNLYALVAENGKDYCHMCGLCTRECPKHIPISDIFRYMMYFENYGKEEQARHIYSKIPDAIRPQSCQECGVCEQACAYGVRVRQQLKKAARILA